MIDNPSDPVHSFTESLEKHFVDIPNKSVKATVKEKPQLNTSFMETAKNFWLTHEGGKYSTIYSEGLMAGTYNTRIPSFDAIAVTFLEAIKNIIRIQCEKEDKTSENFTTNMELIQTAFELLSERIEDTLDSKLDGESMMAYLHSVFNGFINTNIKTRE